MNTLRSIGRAIVVTVQLLSGAAAADVTVNREPLDATTRQRLEQMYQVEIRAGHYWYDKVSGAWGLEGGPMLGQIVPGLPINAPLRQDASGGRTGVVINGRELHSQDVAGLRQCGPVLPGRYWVYANGIGGLEGGPPMFNLVAMCSAAAQQRGETLACDPDGRSCGTWKTRTGVTGVISEGGGRGAVSYNGKYIMTPN